ncbi:uncharacterized protein [Procambarus clarkii]|uniref:uncharacterized protein n=1 Tax=Procambarus clarkii TaxID=6728 RepID=UPI0037445AC8
MAADIDMSLEDYIKTRMNMVGSRTCRDRSEDPQRMSVLSTVVVASQTDKHNCRRSNTMHKREGFRNHKLGESAKVLISNLRYTVTDAEIYELFAEFGTIINAAVNNDNLGKSLGTAYIVFAREADALQALKQYNGFRFHGRPIGITMDGGSAEAEAPLLHYLLECEATEALLKLNINPTTAAALDAQSTATTMIRKGVEEWDFCIYIRHQDNVNEIRLKPVH